MNILGIFIENHVHLPERFNLAVSPLTALPLIHACMYARITVEHHVVFYLLNS